MTAETAQIIQNHLKNGRGIQETADICGVSRHAVFRLSKKLALPAKALAQPEKVDVLTAVRRALLTPMSLSKLIGVIGAPPAAVDEALKQLSAEGVLGQHGDLLSIEKPAFGRIPLNFLDRGGWVTVGLVADTHLACKEERLAELHVMYDLFAKEGIKEVFHAGNIVDGYVPRINGASVIVSGIDDQALYVVDNYPQRAGITTFFITGDDHEGWWQKEGFNYGWYQQQVAEREGRKDLKYIGHVEGDVAIKVREGARDVMLKIQHPGGGSCYARSYTGQKQVEAFQGGEKPDILVQGHYHVANYMPERNVHVIGMPGFQNQTVFARKKRLRMEVGGAILRFKTTEQGAVSRCQVEFTMFYDRGFYTPFLRSDSRLIQGKLAINKA